MSLGAAFGRIDAADLQDFASNLEDLGISDVSLTPWRALVVATPTQDLADHVLAAGLAHGFLADDADPLTRIDACPGARACPCGGADTRAAARRLASLWPQLALTSAHVSGCTKGCARSEAADLVLVGRGDHFDIVRNGRADALPPPRHPSRSMASQRHSRRKKAEQEMAQRDYIRDGSAIYDRSFAIIRSEADLTRFSGMAEKVAVRMIHACGMVELARDILMSPDFADKGREALLKGAPILCDAKMVAMGITKARLPANNPIICTLDDPRTADIARDIGNTRSAAAMELWRPHLEGAVVAIGNAPTSLFHLLDMMDQGAPKPAAVIGLPVGFVGAAESKDALAADNRVPWLIVKGRKGGSAMAVAAVNALASERE